MNIKLLFSPSSLSLRINSSALILSSFLVFSASLVLSSSLVLNPLLDVLSSSSLMLCIFVSGAPAPAPTHCRAEPAGHRALVFQVASLIALAAWPRIRLRLRLQLRLRPCRSFALEVPFQYLGILRQRRKHSR